MKGKFDDFIADMAADIKKDSPPAEKLKTIGEKMEEEVKKAVEKAAEEPEEPEEPEEQKEPEEPEAEEPEENKED